MTNEFWIKRVCLSSVLALSSVISSVAVAQDGQNMFDGASVQKTDLSKLGEIYLPPRDSHSLMLVPEKPANASDISTRESCLNADGKWVYEVENEDENLYRIGCRINNKREGLWQYTDDEYKLTSAQRRKHLTIGEVYDLEKASVSGYTWFVSDIPEGWVIYYNARDKFVSQLSSLKGGIANGPHMEWDKNGRLELVSNYVNGILDGPYEAYVNGLASYFGQYKDGRKTGQWEYYRNGGLYQKINYDDTMQFTMDYLRNDIKYVVDLNKYNILIGEMMFKTEEYSTGNRLYKSGYAVPLETGFGAFVGDTQYYTFSGEPWFVLNLFKSSIDDGYIFDLCKSSNNTLSGFSTPNEARILNCYNNTHFIYKVIEYYSNAQISTITPYSKEDEISGDVYAFRSDGSELATYHMVNNYPDSPAYSLAYYDKNKNPFSPASQIDSQTKSGVFRTFWENGNLRSEAELKNGMRNGLFRSYYESGGIHQEVNYSNNIKNGTLRSWFESGVLSYTIDYLDGAIHGEQKYYYVDGHLAHIQSYENGHLIGTEIEYAHDGKIKTRIVHDKVDPTAVSVELFNVKGDCYAKGAGVMDLATEQYEPAGVWNYFLADGKIWYSLDYNNLPQDKIKCEANNGVFEIDGDERSVGCSLMYPNRKNHLRPLKLRTGNWIWFSENGNVEKKGGFNLGQLHGEWVYYFPNGNLMLSGTYDNGVKNGNWQSFYESGQPRFEGRYVDGIENGEWKSFHSSNGAVASRGQYDNGKKIGHWDWFYDNGQLKDAGEFEAGKETGIWVSYFDNGKKYGEGAFKNGVRVGIWKWWRKSGEFWREAEYIDGREIAPVSDIPSLR